MEVFRRIVWGLGPGGAGGGGGGGEGRRREISTERERDVMLVRNSTGSLFRFPTHTLSSAFEIRAQGSTPSATTKVDPYLVAVFRISHVFFHSGSHFDIFLAMASQRTTPTVQPYRDLHCSALETSS